ncbi:MAG: 16S rRNA (uracil(1498)-N(3))-methyltransferase [Neptunomonas phycophila]
MNLIIFSEKDIIANSASTVRIQLGGRQLAHLLSVHKAEPNSVLRVGQLNGKLGQGRVVSINEQAAILDITLHQAPPTPLPLTLVLALPRPKMMRRIINSISMLGVKDLYLIHSYRVDKSYWSTPFLQPEALHEQLLLGLEQSIDTQLPNIHLRKRFKPFVEDELPLLCSSKRAMVAHPYDAQPCPPSSLEESILAIGPEGGFIPYEIDKLQEAGMQTIEIGQRILRVETAVTALLSRLFPVI